jgi:uncharacterized delta-60 repeat protein
MPACGGGGGGGGTGDPSDEDDGGGLGGGIGGGSGTGGSGLSQGDMGFGTSGGVLTSFGTGFDSANAVALQADGRIVVAGQVSNQDTGDQDFGVVRYNADGTLDAGFSGDGKVTTTIHPSGIGESSGGANAVVVDGSGRIVAAGWAFNDSTGLNEVALVRYNPDGSLDGTFGGDGIVTTVVMLDEDSMARAIAIHSGKIIVAGWVGGVSGDEFAVLRYNDDGTLDTTFGTGDGVVTTTVGVHGQANALAIQDDGKIVVGGYSVSSDTTAEDFALVRYDTLGSLDTTFSNDGIVVEDLGGSSTDQIHGIALQLSGIVVVGTTVENGAGDFALARYNMSDGTRDTSFGNGGVVVESLGTGDDEAYAVAITGDRIMVAGLSSTNGYEDIALARFDQNGNSDATFGSNGHVIVPIGTQADIGNAVAIQPDGKTIVAGSAWNDTNNEDFVVVRYLP